MKTVLKSGAKTVSRKQLSRYIRELEKHGYTVEAQV